MGEISQRNLNQETIAWSFNRFGVIDLLGQRKKGVSLWDSALYSEGHGYKYICVLPIQSYAPFLSFIFFWRCYIGLLHTKSIYEGLHHDILAHTCTYKHIMTICCFERKAQSAERQKIMNSKYMSNERPSGPQCPSGPQQINNNNKQMNGWKILNDVLPSVLAVSASE